jgi:hypothetical protein
MLTSEHPRLSPFVTESSLTPAPSSVGDVPKTRKPRRAVAYIEPPPLTHAERVSHEAVVDRDLPQDFDYDLPLSDRVVIGEYRDHTTLWYYVENTDGVAHRVSVLLIALTLVGNKSPPNLLHDTSLKHLPSQRHSLTLSPSIVSISLFGFARRPNRSVSLSHIRTQEEDRLTSRF